MTSGVQPGGWCSSVYLQKTSEPGLYLFCAAHLPALKEMPMAAQTRLSKLASHYLVFIHRTPHPLYFRTSFPVQGLAPKFPRGKTWLTPCYHHHPLQTAPHLTSLLHICPPSRQSSSLISTCPVLCAGLSHSRSTGGEPKPVARETRAPVQVLPPASLKPFFTFVLELNVPSSKIKTELTFSQAIED